MPKRDFFPGALSQVPKSGMVVVRVLSRSFIRGMAEVGWRRRPPRGWEKRRRRGTPPAPLTGCQLVSPPAWVPRDKNALAPGRASGDAGYREPRRGRVLGTPLPPPRHRVPYRAAPLHLAAPMSPPPARETRFEREDDGSGKRSGSPKQRRRPAVSPRSPEEG